MKKLVLVAWVALFALASCGSSDKEFQKNPVDLLIRDMNKDSTFSIVLYDMDIDEGTFSDTYKHQYQIIKNKNGEPSETKTAMQIVDKDFFMRHQNDMGMEIASKTKDGKIHKQAAPAGYSNYVGNSQYGNWRTDNSGNSFWEFYGKYAMMSSMMNMMAAPIYRNSYDDYNRNYRGSQPYYGKTSTGSPAYGTQSAHVQASKPSFFQRMQGKSSWNASSKSVGSSSSSGTTTRSSSRYSGSSSSSGSSSRSRGGGSGK
ncbi:MAG: hypothetical protein EAZ97_08080 [Bacteroidetes bacterium]|nr:MAG: hypothetical protein EAZ97_08080 [Bacteroidota bacterium]